MTSLVPGRFAIPPLQRTVPLPGPALLAAAMLLLVPASHADTDAESPATEAVQPAATETGAVDSSTAVADSLETSVTDIAAVQAVAVDADTVDAATRAVGLRPSFLARGLRLDGSIGILRDVDLRRSKLSFFQSAGHPVTSSKAEPGPQSGK